MHDKANAEPDMLYLTESSNQSQSGATLADYVHMATLSLSKDKEYMTADTVARTS